MSGCSPATNGDFVLQLTFRGVKSLILMAKDECYTPLEVEVEAAFTCTVTEAQSFPLSLQTYPQYPCIHRLIIHVSVPAHVCMEFRPPKSSFSKIFILLYCFLVAFRNIIIMLMERTALQRVDVVEGELSRRFVIDSHAPAAGNVTVELLRQLIK